MYACCNRLHEVGNKVHSSYCKHDHIMWMYVLQIVNTLCVCSVHVCMNQPQETVKFFHIYVVLAPCIQVLCIVYMHVLCMYVCMYNIAKPYTADLISPHRWLHSHCGCIHTYCVCIRMCCLCGVNKLSNLSVCSQLYCSKGHL